MKEQDVLTADQQAKLKRNMMKAQAVSQAVYEIIGESRAEIITRARAKLVAMGVQVSDEEIGMQL